MKSASSQAIDITGPVSRVLANIEKVLVGKRQQIMLALVAYLAEGHILLEDVPGVAKTMLVRSSIERGFNAAMAPSGTPMPRAISNAGSPMAADTGKP